MKKRIITLLLTVVVASMMAVSAFAVDEFVPSINQKQVPEVVPQQGAGGLGCQAVIYDKDMNVIGEVSAEDLILTPVSATESNPPEILENLKKAFDELKSAGSLKELCDSLESEVHKVSDGVDVNGLVVRDLFDATVVGECAALLDQPGNMLGIRFKVKDADSFVGVLHRTESGEWDMGRLVKNADGTVDVLVGASGPMAFLFAGGQAPVPTGDAGVAVFAVLVLLSGAAAIALRKKA